MIYYNAKDIAKFFLSKESMTHKKLQKLVYYAYSWVLIFHNNKEEKKIENKLFKSRIEAWTHGPVIPELYQEYKEFGWSLIPKINNFSFEENHPDVIKLLEKVYKTYKKYDADELEAMTHLETPWKKGQTYTGKVMTDEDIFEYFFNLQYGQKA